MQCSDDLLCKFSESQTWMFMEMFSYRCSWFWRSFFLWVNRQMKGTMCVKLVEKADGYGTMTVRSQRQAYICSQWEVHLAIHTRNYHVNLWGCPQVCRLPQSSIGMSRPRAESRLFFYGAWYVFFRLFSAIDVSCGKRSCLSLNKTRRDQNKIYAIQEQSSYCIMAESRAAHVCLHRLI